MDNFTHHIEAGSYRIHAGSGALSILNSFLSEERFAARSKFILCDENTVKHCVPLLVAGVNALKSAPIIEVDAGEEAKSLETAKAVWQTLLENGADRNSVLINVGGGMITDLGGFCAAAYMRGIPFVNVPTSLIGMADASFGGKTAIDLDEVKNIIGFFHNPAAVFCLPDFLRTLPSEHVLAGLAEILKHGLIADKQHWHKAFKRAKDQLSADLISDSIRIKISIVNSDPFENGPRKLLNFGHTIGHAIESYYLKTENPLIHGIAVAAGILGESYLSHKSELLSTSELDEITNCIASVFAKMIPVDFNEAEVIQLMSHDKKNKDGNINFTLLNGIGNSVYDRRFETSEIMEALRFLKKICN